VPQEDIVPSVISRGVNRGLNFYSGDDRDRTGDPRLAKAVLYQLSYIPKQRMFDTVLVR
jgi:hypothetical protein